jgi:hypothetical protein
MSKLTDRKKRALDRLQKQLESGTKTEKKGTKKVSLSETDKKRIQKEIEILSK